MFNVNTKVWFRIKDNTQVPLVRTFSNTDVIEYNWRIWNYILFPRRNKLICLFLWIRIKLHFPLVIPIGDKFYIFYTHPLGTPEFIFLQSKVLPFSTPLCFWSLRQNSNKDIKLPLIPSDFNLNKRPSCKTLSNASEMSKKHFSHQQEDCNSVYISLIFDKIWSIHISPGTKSDREGAKSLLLPISLNRKL